MQRNDLEHQLAVEDLWLAQLTTDRAVWQRTPVTVGSVVGLTVVLVAFVIVILAVIILAVTVKILLTGALGFVLMVLGGTRFCPSKAVSQSFREPALTSRVFS